MIHMTVSLDDFIVVLVGALLGSAIAYLSYICYFPSPLTIPSNGVHKDRFDELEHRNIEGSGNI